MTPNNVVQIGCTGFTKPGAKIGSRCAALWCSQFRATVMDSDVAGLQTLTNHTYIISSHWKLSKDRCALKDNASH
eukprot:8478141-Karenia_brevis.AAC.1